MIIYRNNVDGFNEDVDNGILIEKIKEELKFKMNKKVNINEENSWNNSLREMRIVFSDNDISKNIGVAIEYNLPRSSKRIDIILSGLNDEKRRIIIIELKQWQECIKVIGSDMIVDTYVGGRRREVSHPSYQAFAYGRFLNDFSEVVYSNKNIEVLTCAFLHNYDVDKHPDIIDSQYNDYLYDAPLFFKKDLKKLRDYIKENLISGDNAQLIDEIDNGQIRPGKSIQDSMREIIDNNSDFYLLDDQKVVYEKIVSLSVKSKKDNKKRVLIVPGGPGTGKTLIALKVLSSCIQKEQNAIYCSKNASVREAFKKLILDKNEDKKFTKVRLDNLFKGSSIFSDLLKNHYDLTIVDESHRLIERSQYTPIGKGYNNQIREIICESRVSVFFIDEKQLVTNSDIGTIKEIKRQAKLEGILDENILEFEELTSQFRSSGADDYIQFIDNILYDGLKCDMSFRNAFDFKVFDNPQDMYEAIVKKSKCCSARVLAGYCWNWVSKKDKKLYDIVIGNFKRQWNLQNDKYFMLEKNSIEQIGCIHTSQGLEIDYVGVIIGPDLIVKNNKIETDWTKRASTDKSIKGLKKLDSKVSSEIGDFIVRNTYNVLLTRAIKGCYIYCIDENLSKYIKDKLND
ncbi:DUF2075 domain-containing protein [Spiroplasma tabanidicola]|uniref:Schlafen group 3-like DNA/RNA helicase domain-containing protein n=1 Tax=Spiroplasma tabanidicola TaxID=324079 RepID=A0A6I6CCQ4_9MOLU|nr:DUF2075 domain-containing protein [Spiroplasma tabanidicola]QGS52068.1 hypothetical protein STABA_v1c07110 [Spiroplasma tabanidicola]